MEENGPIHVHQLIGEYEGFRTIYRHMVTVQLCDMDRDKIIVARHGTRSFDLGSQSRLLEDALNSCYICAFFCLGHSTPNNEPL